MKRNFTSIVLAGALLVNLNTNAQEQNTQRATTGFAKRTVKTSKTAQQRLQNQISLPGKSQDYQPDGNGGWTHSANSTFSYDTQGRLTQRLEVSPANNDNMRKRTFAFDANGNETENFDYMWQNGQWEMLNGYKSNFTYNSSNKVTEEIDQSWNSASMGFENNWRDVFEYTSNGDLDHETYYGWVNNAWEVEGREKYVYASPNSAPIEILFQDDNNGTFEDVERYNNIVWHDYGKFQPSSYTLQEWDGTNWIDIERGTVTYDANGGSVETLEEYMNGTWTNSERWMQMYDSHANYTGMKGENWSGGTWVMDWTEEEVLTYNANLDITERVFRDTYSMSNTLEDRSKEVYSEFQYVSAAPASITELAISVYPNPVQNRLSITGHLTEATTVTFTDLTGRTILVNKIQPSAASVDVSALTSGTYILQLSNSEGSKIAKIVKL